MQYRSVVVAEMLFAGWMTQAIPYSDSFADGVPISDADSSNALSSTTADETNVNLFQDSHDNNLGSTVSLGGDFDDGLLGDGPPDDLFLAADQSGSGCGYVSRHRKREENADETFLGIYAQKMPGVACFSRWLTIELFFHHSCYSSG